MIDSILDLLYHIIVIGAIAIIGFVLAHWTLQLVYKLSVNKKRTKLESEMRSFVVDGDSEGLTKGFARVIWRESCTTFVSERENESRSLNQLLDEINYSGFGVVFVIIETQNHGCIYQYSSLNNCWSLHGITVGTA